MSIRWHTDPNPAFFQTPKPPKELSDLININSETALYLLIQQTITTNPTKPPNLKLEGEDIEWLKSIETSFDSYVTRVLNTLHIEPWDYDHRIKDEYARVYGTPYVSTYGGGGSIRSVMGRLMTYKEIWNYAREAEDRTRCSNTNGSDWFWRRPEPKPVWSNSSNFSSSSFHSNDGRMPFMTGIHPKDKNRVYTVTYKKPWCSSNRFSELDPTHNWGVFIDQTASYTDDLPIRVLMACCAEPVGKTEGCWIALPEDTTAVEGIIKPYRVYHSVFNSVWSNISNNSPLPTTFQNDIKNNYSMGTAFQDVSKYEELHQRIKKALEDAAPIIEQAYKDYQAELQATLDRLEEAGDSQRNTDPFSTILKTQEKQDAVTLPIRLRDEFNAIQAIDMDKPDGPLVLKDHVNQRVFQVGEMLKEFTFAKMGGIQVKTTGGKTTRIKMLNSKQMDKTNLESLVKTILNATSDPNYTKFLSPAQLQATQTLKVIDDIMAEQATVNRLNALDTEYQLLLAAGVNKTALEPTGLNWNEVQRNQIKGFKDSEESVISNQKAINVSLRSLRTTNPQVVSATPLVSVVPLLPAEEALLPKFKENMDVEMVKRSVPMKDEAEPLLTNAPALSPVELNDQYVSAANAYQRANDLQKDANLPIATQGKVKERPGFKTALATVEKTLRDQNNVLESLKKNLRQSIARLLYINNLNVSNDVKRRSVVELGISDRITNLDLLNTTIETKKNDARKKFEQALKIEIDAYNQEQNKNKTNATTVLATFDTNNQKLIIDDTTGIEKLKNNLLAAVAPLAVIDDLEQLYVNYNAKLQTVFSNLPEATLVAQAPKAKKYINAWQTSVLAASIALAQALQNLIVNLNDVNTKSTDDALATLETEVTTAKALVETEEARKIRLAREAAEKAEKERVEINRLRALVENTVFDAWILQPNVSSFILNSSSGIRSLQNLWDDVKNKISAIALPFRFIIPRPNTTLVQRLINDEAIRDEISINDMQNQMYVEGLSLDEMKQAWIVFKEFLVHVGSSQQGQKLLDLQNVKTIEQPNRVVKRVVDQPVKTTKSLVTFEKYETNGYAGLMTTKSLEWINNSCWIDTVMMSLFSIPQTSIVKNIYNATTIKTNSLQVAFPTSTKTLGCTPVEAANIHNTLINDIDYIQNPEIIPSSHTCSVRPLWDNLCGPKRVKDSTFATPNDVFSNLLQFYPDSFSYDTTSALLSNIYTDYVIPAGANNNHVWDIFDNGAYIFDALQSIIVPRFFDFGKNTTHTLAAVIYALFAPNEGNSHHFITHIQDFETNVWYHYDRNLFSQDLQMRELTSQEYSDNLNNLANYKYTMGNGNVRDEYRVPVCFVFFSNAEVAQLKSERQSYKKGVAVPAPSTLWDSPFKTTAPDEILKTIRKNLLNTPTEKDWLTKLGLFNSVTEELITDTNELGDSPAIRYAYYHFSEWLSQNDPGKRTKLEIKIRKALAAAQPIPEEQELQLLGIKKFPDDLRITNALKKVLLPQIQKKPLETVVVRKRVFAARFQIKFSELEN